MWAAEGGLQTVDDIHGVGVHAGDHGDKHRGQNNGGKNHKADDQRPVGEKLLPADLLLLPEDGFAGGFHAFVLQ